MHVKTSIPLMVLSLIIGATADSGYGEQCNSIHYYNGRDGSKTFFANCRKNSGIFNVDTVINPDACFGNFFGRLVALEDGDYSQTCKDVNLAGTILHANCLDLAGNYIYSEIETNDWIGVDDGRMKCFGKFSH